MRMFLRKRPVTIAAVACAALLSVAVAHLQASGQVRSGASIPTGRITPWAAIRIALRKVPGRALQATYEFDGARPDYDVVIVTGKKLKEVELDAISGKVTDSESVDPQGEASELRAELLHAVGGKAAPAEVKSNAGG
ncbi:MAG: PepSY domain-containing protein [Armatimonadetes bacterium]|nr:PepSY domain-containing protein [Armatimonadota bacterium]MDE2206477.1 PepSY domain-containing protein [Armatimonadota bacterium]